MRSITRHHLIPRARARKLKRRKKGRERYSREDLERTVGLCGPCHRNVHDVLTNQELQWGYDSVAALGAHPGVQRFTEWVRDKPHGAA